MIKPKTLISEELEKICFVITQAYSIESQRECDKAGYIVHKGIQIYNLSLYLPVDYYLNFNINIDNVNVIEVCFFLPNIHNTQKNYQYSIRIHEEKYIVYYETETNVNENLEEAIEFIISRHYDYKR